MSSINNAGPTKISFKTCPQQVKQDQSSENQHHSSETSKEFMRNNSYYETSNQQYRNRGKKENMSDLSVLIYEGLETARMEVLQNNLIAKLEETYKKQIQMEIEQCKELQSLTMMNILKDKQAEILEKQADIEVQITNLKEELYYIQRRLKSDNPEINPNQLKSTQQARRLSNFNIIRKTKGRSKIQKLTSFDIQQNTQQTLNNQYEVQNDIKQTNFQKFYQSENLSTIPSRCSSFLTCQLIGTPSTSPTHLNQKKLLLFNRMKIMKEEVKLSERNFEQKAHMMNCEISLLKKQLSIVNENIEKNDILDAQKHSPEPVIRNTQSKLRQKSTSPRFTSQGANRKSEKFLMFKPQKKSARPSMFHNKKVKNYSPSIYRCTSQQKIQRHMYLHAGSPHQRNQQEWAKIKSNMLDEKNQDDYPYFTNKRHQLAIQSKACTNKRKNVYYS